MPALDASMDPHEDARGYVCTVLGCNKAYRRNEHLERHLRSHRLQKPFDCPVCHKNYGRQDVLKRHVASQHSSTNSRRTSRRRRRVVAACNRCHSRKAACTGELPCQACQRSNSLCQYPCNTTEPARAAEDRAAVPVEPQTPAYTTESSLYTSALLHDQPSGDGYFDVDTMLLAGQSGHTPPQSFHLPTPAGPERNGSIATLNSNDVPWEALDRAASQHPREIPAEPAHLTAYPPVSPQSPDENYRVEPFARLSTLGAEAALPTASPEQPLPRPPVTSDSPHAITTAVSSIDETGAVRGRICPDGPSQDEMPAGATAPASHLDRQTLDYIFDSTFLESALPSSAQDLWLPAPSGIFNSSLAFLSTTNEAGLSWSSHGDAWAPDNLPLYSEASDTASRPAAPSLFPLGLQTLKHCIDIFFAKFHRLWAVVHRATFKLETDDQGLVDTMAMIGAWESGIPSWMDAALDIHKKITEKLRDKLFSPVPKQDVGLRWPVSTYQTLLLNAIFTLQVSDNQFFSEAYMQHSIMLSVFREAGLFNEQYILARHDAKGAIPSSWLRRESLKRLAYFAFRLDIYFYFLRGYRPMLRYDEFCLTLPCSERLWEAQTAEEWHKVKLIESRKRNPMYFTHLVDQAMDQNCRATLPPLLEDEYLYGLCAMQAWLWQDAQRHRSRTESAGVRSNLQSKTPASFSRSSEFWTKQLTLWKEGYRDRVLGPELSSKGHRETLEISAIPLYHLSQIVLAANVETLKELATDSRLRPYSGTFRRQLESSTLRWVQTPDARLAVWHAAKILKLLRDKFGQQDTQGNNPSSTIPHIGLIASIALYEAGLVVWAYARSVQVCDACSMGSSLQAASDSLESFELFGMEQDEPFRHWLEHGGRELMDGRSVCACNLSSLVGLYEAVLLRCGSQWRCVSQMAQSLSQLKQGD